MADRKQELQDAQLKGEAIVQNASQNTSQNDTDTVAAKVLSDPRADDMYSMSYADAKLKYGKRVGKASTGIFMTPEQFEKNKAIWSKSREDAAPKATTTATEPVAPVQTKQASNLGGMTTDEWVASQKSKGLSDDEIAEAYEKEGYSRNGEKFKSAMQKYSKPAEDATKTEPTALDDTTAQDKAFEKKEALTELVDSTMEKHGESLKNLYDTMEDEYKKKYENRKNAAELAEFMPKWAIAHYLDGDFGKRGSGKALGTLGYFLMDKIGTSLSNASLVARGMSPSQKTALQTYNETMLENAMKRDDVNRSQIMSLDLDNVSKNADALRQAGYDTKITLAKDMYSDYLQKYGEQIDSQALVQMKKQAADYYDKMSDADKAAYDRYLAVLSSDPDRQMEGMAKMQKAKLDAKYATDDATKTKAYAEAAITVAQSQLTQKQIDMVQAQIDNAIRSGKLTEAQASLVWKDVALKQKDLDWYNANALQKQITGYVDTASGVIDSIIPDSLF